MITKTDYLSYITCPKQFWLGQYRPDLTTPADPAALRRLQAGLEVDRLAREQFPGGVLISYRSDPADMVPLTTQAIAEGAETVFQGTFSAGDLLIKADILTRTPAGWHLIEVKSTTSVKEEEHLPDVAFQLYVLGKAGITVTQASLMYLNKECRAPELADLFVVEDVTGPAVEYLPLVDAAVPLMRQIESLSRSPDVGIGRHCLKPDTCAFHAHCWHDVDGLTIYEVPNLKRPQEEQLEAAGVRYVVDIPPGFSLGHRRAESLVRMIAGREITINAAAIRARLAELRYPLYFLDFETIDYAIPRFDGCDPYRQVPFQYSCHVMEEDGTLRHCEYLHTAGGDPRRPLAQSLLAHVGGTGHLVAYNAPFERQVLRHLAAQFPEYGDRLLGTADRLWDQLAIFRSHYRHHAFGKSNSLKSVLPVVVPHLSYDALAVSNGTQAQVAWEEMNATPAEAEKQRLAAELREYCRLDTLAMVEIHRVLCRL